MGVQAQVSTVGNAGVHGPRMIAGIEHFLQRRVEDLRQALPAPGRIAGQARPTALDVGLVRSGEAVRCVYLPVDQATALTIA
ncbi:hypothetical protein D3C76_1244340 [compost metagenome]